MKTTASKRPLKEKLGIRAGYRMAILNPPRGYTSILADLPSDTKLTTRLAGEPFDVIQGFYLNQRSLKADLRKIRKAIQPKGKIWICWKKGKVTDLSREVIWELGENVGLDSVASCAIDEEWAAMKLMLPKDERTPDAAD